MGGHHSARAQRMDLLDDFGQDSGDKASSRKQGVLGTHRRNEASMLLDRLYTSD